MSRLQIALTVCVDPAYFQSDVEKALSDVLGSRILPDGTKGLFYPDNFTFGQTVYLSPIYAAARKVAGVRSVVATVFQPQGTADFDFPCRTARSPSGHSRLRASTTTPAFPITAS